MRETWVRAIEGSALTLFSFLTAALTWHLGVSLLRVGVLVPAAILGYAAGDFVSGLVHWFCDNCFREDSPLVGPLLIRPFREHHRDPLGITRHGFLELTGNSCLALIPTLAAVVWWSDRLSPLFAATILFFHLTLFATNLFHKWAHTPAVPGPVRWLQRHRLILTPARHQMHHRNGFAGAYCITSGWMNRPLDRLLRAR